MSVAFFLLPALLLVPLCAALFSWFIPMNRLRRILLLFAATLEMLLTMLCWVVEPGSWGGDLLCLDAPGQLVLSLTVLLFFIIAFYAVAYLQEEDPGARTDFLQGLRFSNAPEASFTACLLLFLTSAVLAAITRHPGVLWVGIESTTVASAPLIYFHRHRRSLEATWKYLLVCSVGIALAFIGNILLEVSLQVEGSTMAELAHDFLPAGIGRVHPAWFKAAFIFLLIGYGTKMGIAPMHTWLPDAHSEAPSLVSALLSGALLNCAFLGIFRAQEMALAVGLGSFTAIPLLFFGFFSMLVATLFIVNLGDFKRMLAYSSVEHMGILLIALGTGLEAAKGGMLHMVGHSLAKAALFLLSGNILAKYHTKSSHDVTGMARTLPVTSALWLAGIIAITGTPPFVLFMSEFSVLQGLLHRGLFGPGMLYIGVLGIVFVGMITPVLRMYRGSIPPGLGVAPAERLFLVLPPACLLLLALALGLLLPGWLADALEKAATVGYRP